MSRISFQEAMESAESFALSPGCKTEITGYFTNCRVDRLSVPEGWFAYDFRHGDSGELRTLEPFVLVNHGGTFLTQQEVPMNASGYRSLSGHGGYTFLCTTM